MNETADVRSPQKRPVDWVRMANYAMVPEDAIPAVIRLGEHQVEYPGAEPSTLRGVYGPQAMTQGVYWADTAAHRIGKKVVVLETWVEIQGATQSAKERLDVEGLARVKMLDLRRIKADLRGQLVDKLYKLVPPADRPHLGSGAYVLDQILVRHPYLVAVIFEQYPHLQGIVHPVAMSFGGEPSEWPALFVLTLRDRSCVREMQAVHYKGVEIEL